MKGEIPDSVGWDINVSNLGMAKLNSNATPWPCPVAWGMEGVVVAADNGCARLWVHVSALGTSGRKEFILLTEVKIISFTAASCRQKLSSGKG